MLPVLLANIVEFLISAVYIGGLPVADQVILKPGKTRITGAESGKTILGETDNMKKKEIIHGYIISLSTISKLTAELCKIFE